MRRVVSKRTGDVFSPCGPLREELELASSAPEEVVRILADYLSDDRKRRIDEVISHRTQHLALAVDGVHDPHNTAAVIRTADAFGIQTVHIIEHDNRFLSSRKITQGAHKWVDLGVFKTPADFGDAVRAQGKKMLVATAQSTTSVEDLDPNDPMVLIFGNEADGISAEMSALADGSFSIPMCGFSDSLNVSVAAAVTAFTLRQKHCSRLEPTAAEILRARFYLRSVRAGYEIVMRSRPDWLMPDAP